MANAVMTFSGYTTVTAKIENLSYYANSYNQFIFRLYKWNGSAWASDGEQFVNGSSYGSVYYASYDFTGKQPGSYYYVETFANYGGVWYPNDPSVGSGFTTDFAKAPSIPEATFSNVVIQKTTISFDYTNSVGNMSLFIWNGNSWVGIASSGLPYTTTAITGGYRITITNLVPDYSYSFHVKTYVGSYYSWSPNNSFNIYTTEDWPKVPSEVVADGWFDGGLYLSWGDHGYESYGFNYGLTVDGVEFFLFGNNTGNNWYFGDYGVQHSFRVTAGYYGRGVSGNLVWYADGNGRTSTTYYYTAPDYPSTVTINSTTATSINLTASGISGNYSAVEWRWRVSGSGSAFSTSINYSGSLSVTISGLTKNTTYEVRCYGYYGTAGLYSADYNLSYVTTEDIPRLSTPTLTTATTTKSIGFAIGTVSNAIGYNVSCTGQASLNFNNLGGSGGFYDLIHNTSYSVSVYAKGDNINYRDSLSRTYTVTTNLLATPGLPTNISLSQQGTTQYVNISFTKGTNAVYTDIDMTDNTSNWGIVNWVNQSNTNYTLDTGFYGVHYFRLRSLNDDGYNKVYSAWTTTYTVNFTNRPNNFAWTTNIVSGGNIYNTDLANKTLYPFTAIEWNNFTSRINEFRVYKGLSNYSFTTVSSGTFFTKTIFNEARNALADLSNYFTGAYANGIKLPSIAVTGTPILVASYYINMKDSLNSIA